MLVLALTLALALEAEEPVWLVVAGDWKVVGVVRFERRGAGGGMENNWGGIGCGRGGGGGG